MSSSEQQLRFDNQTVVVTGAGGGLGKAYCLLFGSRGANVVVNDLGGSFKGEGKSSKAADAVVEEIRQAGGKAVANYDNVENGESIIDTAIQNFGRIDILINNAGILRDISFKNMEDKDWDLTFAVHVTGAYKLAMVGFTESLAKEGAKYNILCNVIAPIAASRMTETVMPPDLLSLLKPDYIAPIVAVLVHRSNDSETGSIFEVGGGHVAKLRWERAKGLLLRPDESMSPGSILKGWDRVKDFSTPQHASGVANFMELLEDAMKLPGSEVAPKLDFKGKVAVVTGGGAGLGRGYCILLSSLGAKVVVNDLANPDDVVKEVQKAGGEAVPAKYSCEDGEAIVNTAIQNYGRIDILINNAGILRDKAFNNMSDDLWFPVMNTHARGTYKCTKAAWPHFLKQKYGRIVNTTSTSGIYGNFGQANYSAAKCAILGFSRALALEGAKHNINVNTIAPNAGTAMTRTIMPEDMVQAFKPWYVAPLVALLCSDSAPDKTGKLYEVGSGWQAETHWQRSGGHGFPVDVQMQPEHVRDAWSRIVEFDDGRADHPVSTQEGLKSIMANSENKVGSGSGKCKDAQSSTADTEGEEDYLAAIARAKSAVPEGTPFTYTHRDVIFYNLSLSSPTLDHTFEGHPQFHALPTFATIPPFNAKHPFDLSQIVPNFSPLGLLHGETFIEIGDAPIPKPNPSDDQNDEDEEDYAGNGIPTEGTLTSYPKLVDVVDKKNAAVVTVGTSTYVAGEEKQNAGRPAFYTESTIYLRGCGSFGGASSPQSRPPYTTTYAPPAEVHHADFRIEEQTTPDQAKLYRLNGDYNPLHIDPQFARMAGFKGGPILHGLCTLGLGVKHVLEGFKGCNVKRVKGRFTGTVMPGEKLRTESWRAPVSPGSDTAGAGAINEANVVIFRTSVVEGGGKIRKVLEGWCELVALPSSLERPDAKSSKL
ncbi:MAG: hypothetical protein M1831_005068 [Alyxoria varia]|nr:MAG: hypothetical protein M1831_005068 [Alyxoria varia]